MLTYCIIEISFINIKVAGNVLIFCSKSRISEVDSTEEQMLIKAPSRNRAVYRLRGPFLGTFLGKQKGTKLNFKRIS